MTIRGPYSIFSDKFLVKRGQRGMAFVIIDSWRIWDRGGLQTEFAASRSACPVTGRRQRRLSRCCSGITIESWCFWRESLPAADWSGCMAFVHCPAPRLSEEGNKVITFFMRISFHFPEYLWHMRLTQRNADWVKPFSSRICLVSESNRNKYRHQDTWYYYTSILTFAKTIFPQKPNIYTGCWLFSLTAARSNQSIL